MLAALDDSAHALGQLDVLQAEGDVLLQVAQVHSDELGQVRRHTRHFEFGHDVGHQAVVEFDRWGLFFTAEVQWHLHVQLGLGIDTLEVDVQHELFVRVVLHIAQQHFAGGASNFHVQHAGVESFFFQGVPQSVVIDFDQLGLTGTTVNDTRRLACDAETAARTRTLQGALKSDKLHN